MRQLIILASLLLASTQTFAFSNVAVLKATDRLVVILKHESSADQRSRTLEAYKSFVTKQIDQMDMPEDGLSATDEQAQEFASLNEFEEYLSNVNARNVSKDRCERAIAHLQASSHGASDELGTSISASDAVQRIIESLCQ